MIKPRKKILTRESLLEILKAEQPYLKKHFGVKRMAIFGSFSKGTPTAGSDIDIFVELGSFLGFEFLDMIDYLEKKLGRKVEVLTPAGIQSIRVKSISQNIRRSLLYV